MAEIPCIYCITEVQELTEQNVLTNCDGIDITFMEECFHLSAIEIRVKYYHRAKASKGMENNQEDEEKSKEADDNYKDGGLKRGDLSGSSKYRESSNLLLQAIPDSYKEEEITFSTSTSTNAGESLTG